MEVGGKTALITGSSVGVGRAVALRLARKGCNVVINYSRSESEAAEAVEECRSAGAAAIAVQADISMDPECRRLVETAVQRFGSLQILVNNAGTTEFVSFADLEGLTEQIWEKTFRTNVMGSFFCARAAVPPMIVAGEGAIVNVASIAGILPLGSSIAYAASKAAMISMSESLAKTLGPEIRVNAVAPGAVDTRWLRQGLGDEGFESLRKSLREVTPLQKVSAADDVADAVVWLIEGARMVTGETVLVDGGYHLGAGHSLASLRR